MSHNAYRPCEKRPAASLYPEAVSRIKQGKCARCQEPVGPFRDEISAREYRISGLCQSCQDKIFQK